MYMYIKINLNILNLAFSYVAYVIVSVHELADVVCIQILEFIDTL